MADDVVKRPRAPVGLAARGRKLWRAVVGTYALTASELEVLTEACRTADDVERLAAAVVDEPMIVEGSAGQPRPNPLLRELRDTRSLLGRLLALLALPDAEAGEWDGLTASQRARKAAGVRWRRGA